MHLAGGGGLAPQAGDSVWIQVGQTIVLDVSPPRLYMIIVQGHFVFDRTDLELELSYLFVMGGSLTIGTEREPFLQRAQITLIGSPVSQEIPLYGSKVIGCRECTLDLHGKPLMDGRTHTKLAQTAVAGAQELWLMQPVDWDIETQVSISFMTVDGRVARKDDDV